MTPIAVTGLSKVYPGGIETVQGLTFEVAAGEVFGLLGPNGAGGSTTIGMLTTTVSPTRWCSAALERWAHGRRPVMEPLGVAARLAIDALGPDVGLEAACHRAGWRTRR